MADDPRSELTPPTYVRRLRRWRFALILAVLLAAVVAAAAAGWRFARTSSSPSNGPFILISVDTLRADHLPLYGSRTVRTPAIDALAAEGVVFERAYAHSPQTLPSHASILSGQLPFETGVRDDFGFTLRPDVALLPQMLKSNGYASGAVVSSYLLRRETGLARGFDFYDGEMPAASPEFPGGCLERPGVDSIAVARKWIASLASPRFLLFLHLYEPHSPYASPDRFREYAPYDGEIAYADELVGGFLKWLKGRGLYDRATILLFSDHGEGLGDHGEQEHGVFLYDEAIRVPLIVKLPRDVNHGHRVTAPVQQIDLVPTVLDLLDMQKPAALGGRSLRSLIEGRRASFEIDRPIYAESLLAHFRFGLAEAQAVTSGSHRLIEAPRAELYDFTQDPGERTNVFAGQPQVASRLRASLDEIAARAAPAEPEPPSFEERQRLAALGYLGAGPSTRTADAPADAKDHIAALEKCRQASFLLSERRFDEATEIYRDLLKGDPQVAGVWLQMARVLERAGRAAEAVHAFDLAAQASPGEPTALLGAANALLRAGKLDAARERAQKAVKSAPARAHETLARIALARNNPSEAAREAERADESDPTLSMRLFVQAVTSYKSGKYDQAASLFAEALGRTDGHAEPVEQLHYYYADTLARLARYPDAELHFKEEIRLFPQNIAPRVSLALLFRAERRLDDARAGAEDLAKVAPSADSYAAAARVWTILGDKERASLARSESKQRFGRDAIAEGSRAKR